MKTIYVGNIPFRSQEQDIQTLFEQYGTVHSVKFIMDRNSGKFRGFGFIEMDEAEADAAIEALNGSEFEGRIMRINEARGRSDRRPDYNNNRGGGSGGRYYRSGGRGDGDSGSRHRRF